MMASTVRYVQSGVAGIITAVLSLRKATVLLCMEEGIRNKGPHSAYPIIPSLMVTCRILYGARGTSQPFENLPDLLTALILRERERERERGIKKLLVTKKERLHYVLCSGPPLPPQSCRVAMEEGWLFDKSPYPVIRRKSLRSIALSVACLLACLLARIRSLRRYGKLATIVTTRLITRFAVAVRGTWMRERRGR